MKQWFIRAALVGLGSFIGSLVVENLTRLAISQFVPRVHDVQFALLITALSLLGGILGGISVAAFLLAKAQRFKVAASLLLVFGGIILILCMLHINLAPQAFDNSQTPLIDALAYVSCTLLWSIVLVGWGALLLFRRPCKLQLERVS